jgi:hypothetical protein
MPTRYFVDIHKDSEKFISEKIRNYFDLLEDLTLEKKKIQKEKRDLCIFLKNILTDQFLSGKNDWFFKKLRF